jgi:hypothetical protein
MATTTSTISMLKGIPHSEKIVFPITNKIEWRTVAFFLVSMFVVFIMLYVVHTYVGNEPESASFKSIFKAIMYLVGAAMFVGFILELLKKEEIILTRYELIHKYMLAGISVFEKHYHWEGISDLQVAPVPINKWEKTDQYKDMWRSKASYTKNISHAYSPIQFRYHDRLVELAQGLKPSETVLLLQLIEQKREAKSV